MTSSGRESNKEQIELELERRLGPLKDWFLFYLDESKKQVTGEECWRSFMEFLDTLVQEDRESDIAAIRDICERNLKSKIQELEAFYFALASDHSELVCRYKPDGTLSFVNESYCRYFGKSASQMIRHHFAPLIPDADLGVFLKKMTSLDEENPVTVIEHRVILPNGEIRWLRWLMRMVFNKDGRHVGYQSKGTDVTKQRLETGQDMGVLSTDSGFHA